ncbi:MAG: peptidoglycan-binding protein [Actinomycetota bacterium]|nr:peptidoglycan-binding protein [Actinomycetota bacterium]
MRRGLVILAVLLVVVAAAAAGWVGAAQIRSPAQVAAETEPPEPSLITVPVEEMVISNDVITRGTVRFEEPESIFVSSVALEGVLPVVTWMPGIGDEFVEGDILYEIAGRPAFVLEGDLPLFRTVRIGDEGEDVAQLQEALVRLGFDLEEIDGVYGGETEDAVVAFYESRGYEPLEPTDLAREAYTSARDAYNASKDAVADAQRSVQAAKAVEAGAAQALKVAQDRLAQAEAGTDPDTGLPPTPEELAGLRAEVDAAAVALSDASAQVVAADSGLKGAKRSQSASGAVLSQARAALGYPAPETEFLFFAAFPIRVDSVLVERGDIAEGEIMQVSGARLAIDSAVKVAEAEYVTVGAPVMIELDRLAVSMTGTVSFVAGGPGTDDVAVDRVYVEILPDEVRADLNNTNVKITIPVASRSTSGAVLAVPAAALSATGAGDTIVTVEDPDGSTRSVTVTPGLSTTGGMVEVTPIDGALEAGDRVVVGTQTGP